MNFINEKDESKWHRKKYWLNLIVKKTVAETEEFKPLEFFILFQPVPLDDIEMPLSSWDKLFFANTEVSWQLTALTQLDGWTAIQKGLDMPSHQMEGYAELCYPLWLLSTHCRKFEPHWQVISFPVGQCESKLQWLAWEYVVGQQHQLTLLNFILAHRLFVLTTESYDDAKPNPLM